jgi:hypothetical protein
MRRVTVVAGTVAGARGRAARVVGMRAARAAERVEERMAVV